MSAKENQYSIQFLGSRVSVTVDRPARSIHPKHKFVYPVNYGYVEGIMAPDGDYLDAYVLGVTDPVAKFYGKCIAVIHRLNDNDDKLVVVPEGEDYSDHQIRRITNFQERFFKSVIIRK